jgi:hypothetical protein
MVNGATLHDVKIAVIAARRATPCQESINTTIGAMIGLRLWIWGSPLCAAPQ